MKNRNAKRKWVFLSASMLIAACVISAGVFSARRQQPNKQQQRKRVVELPLVISHVPKLVIVSISVTNPGTPAAIAVVEILNTSDLPVMSVEISTRNDAGDSGAVNEDGLDDADKPQVVIPPHGTKKLEMALAEMVPDAPLVLSAAVFADGSEEGDQWSRDAMRAVRAHHQELRRAQKQSQQKGGVKP